MYLLAGFLVGACVGITGVGGGSLMTPILILLFGKSAATAVGTDLLYAAITKMAGTAVHGLNRTVDWGVVLKLASGSVPAAALTIVVLSHLGEASPEVTRAISVVLGAMLLVTSATLFLRRPRALDTHARRQLSPAIQTLATVAFGAVVGMLVSVTSVGAGAIGVTVLMLLYPRLSLMRIVATDIAHAIPLTLVAGIGHWVIGSVDGVMLFSLCLGSIPGVALASRFAYRLPETFVRFVLATILFILGSRLVVG